MTKPELEKEVKRLAEKVNGLESECAGLESANDYLKDRLNRALQEVRRVKEQANYRGNLIKHLAETYFTFHYTV